MIHISGSRLFISAQPQEIEHRNVFAFEHVPPTSLCSKSMTKSTRLQVRKHTNMFRRWLYFVLRYDLS